LITDYVNEHINFDEHKLVEAIANVGPVSAHLNANHDFQFYGDGVFDQASKDCSSKRKDSNHAVALVGYGTDLDTSGNNIDYYILRNSWGVSWGLFGERMF
jgi:C1A family cysteine protease